MTHLITATDRDYHLSSAASLDPKLRPVRIEDVAHQLAQINRFAGACIRPYSVAEHSLLCSEIAERAGMALSVQLCALLHNAHEIYTGDLSSPAKAAVNRASAQAGGTNAWTVFEKEHESHVRAQFGLASAFAAHRHRIRHLDLVALATERRDLLEFDPARNADWPELGFHGTWGEPQGMHVEPIDWIDLDTPERAAMSWYDWRNRFQDRYDELTYAINIVHGGGEAVPARGEATPA